MCRSVPFRIRSIKSQNLYLPSKIHSIITSSVDMLRWTRIHKHSRVWYRSRLLLSSLQSDYLFFWLIQLLTNSARYASIYVSLVTWNKSRSVLELSKSFLIWVRRANLAKSSLTVIIISKQSFIVLSFNKKRINHYKFNINTYLIASFWFSFNIQRYEYLITDILISFVTIIIESWITIILSWEKLI